MNTHELKGIDGTNPLGFLAAMGAFRVSALHDPDAKLAWQTVAPVPYPLLTTTLSQEGFAQAVCKEALHAAAAVKKLGDVIKCSPAKYRETCMEHLNQDHLPGDLSLADYFSAFASDATTDEKGDVRPTLFSFSNGGGGQNLLKDFATLATMCNVQEVVANIFQNKNVTHACTNTNWDPAALRSYALRWKDPEKSDKETNVPMHTLAFLGLAFFTSVPKFDVLATSGFDDKGKTWTWPIWEDPVRYREIASLLAVQPVYAPGIRQYSTRRFSSNKRLYFAPFTSV